MSADLKLKESCPQSFLEHHSLIMTFRLLNTFVHLTVTHRHIHTLIVLIRHTHTDSTQHGDLPRTENDGGNSWKRLHSSLGLARDDDDDDDDTYTRSSYQFHLLSSLFIIIIINS